MSSQHNDILQPLPWDAMLRRSSMASRRGSGISISLFDSPFFSMKGHDGNDTDCDPLAPLSIEEGIGLGFTNHLPQVTNQSRQMYERMMHDRSESSVPSVSASSYSSSMSMQSSNSHYQPPQYHHQQQPHHHHQHTSPQPHPSSPVKSAPAKLSPAPALVSPKCSVDEDEDDDEMNQHRFKPFHEEKWSYRYKELVTFHQETGHAAVPHTYPKNPQLARWVKRQRRQYKLRKDNRPSTMTTVRLDLLNSIGFIWDSHDVNWREKLENLREFKIEHEHCNVPSNYRDKKLATWVKCQRRQYKLYWDGKPSAMSPARIMELEKVGFEWEIRSTAPRNQPTVSSVSLNNNNDFDLFQMTSAEL